MARPRDPYVVLGIKRGASQEEIRRAYRAAQVREHPDRNPDDPVGAAARFREVNEAHEKLCDPRYVPPRPEPEPYEFVFDPLLARTIQKRRESEPQPGDRIDVCAELTPKEAAIGRAVEVEVERTIACGECGYGAMPGFIRKPGWCCACNGRGRSLGCPTCNGTGRNMVRCEACHERGTVKVTSMETIAVPMKVADGTELRCPGRGQPGKNGGRPGDLYVTIYVRDPDEQ